MAGTSYLHQVGACPPERHQRQSAPTTLPPGVLAIFLLITVFTSALGSPRELASTPPMCPIMGTTSGDVSPIKIPTCEQFYPTDAAIRVPQDTAITKYGMLSLGFSSEAGDFIDRTGAQWPLNLSLPMTVMSDIKALNQLIVKATLTGQEVTAITPILFIPVDTMVKPFRTLSFVGVITNWGAPANVNATNWFRWDFGSTIKRSGSFHVLEGNVVNLYKAARDASGKCYPALCSPTSPNSPRCQWYGRFIGKSAAMSMYWDPAMHVPMDSELVPWFSSGISYMYRVPTPNQLLAGNVNLKQTYKFTIHGNPMGTVFQFVGKFSKRGAPVYCK